MQLLSGVESLVSDRHRAAAEGPATLTAVVGLQARVDSLVQENVTFCDVKTVTLCAGIFRES